MTMKKSILIIILIVFLGNNFCLTLVQAKELFLPDSVPMGQLSPAFNPPILKGIKVYPKQPFRFDFILDKGDSEKIDQVDGLRGVSMRLVNYFLASLTIPEDDLWVNLSPYEKERIVPDVFGRTEMGRDLLAQDYLLKQVTASVIYPESELGRKFWERIYALAQEKYGSMDIPVDVFDKVWIVPEKAVVFENAEAGVAYIVESRLKVMLETDYFAQNRNIEETIDGILDSRFSLLPGKSGSRDQVVKDIMSMIIIPELEREVNEGKNFVQLRQIYQSLILAAWYKRKMREGILGRVYINLRKTSGIDSVDEKEKDRIWLKYVQGFKEGVFSIIKEDKDFLSGEMIPRKYFSGGASFDAAQIERALLFNKDSSQIHPVVGGLVGIGVQLLPLAGSAGSGEGLPGRISHTEQRVLNEPDVKLASELTDSELEEEWIEYIKEEGLDAYSHLLPLFPKDIKTVLLDDRTLRPVFMQTLPKESLVGELNVPAYSKDILKDQSGDQNLFEFIKEHRVFKIGSAEVADRLLAKNSDLRIVVGVVDKWTTDTLSFNVANGRQVYFPWKRGFIGIKGSGQFLNDSAPPFFKRKESIKRTGYAKEIGLVNAEEVVRAMTGYEQVKDGGGSFVPFLASQEICSAPDGKGGLIAARSNFLVFTRVLSPQRLIKLPQLLKADPELRKFRKKLSLAMIEMGLLPENTRLTLSDVMEQVLLMVAVNEAVKQNVEVEKQTLHAQDWGLAAYEADIEEFIVNKTEESRPLIPEGVDTRGIYKIIKFINSVDAICSNFRINFGLFFPNLEGTLHILLRTYFQQLNQKWLSSWALLLQSYFDENPTWQKFTVRDQHVINFIREEIQIALTREENDRSMITNKGGIDFKSDRMSVWIGSVQRHQQMQVDSAISQRMKNVRGFYPVILKIQLNKDLELFLGYKK